MIAGRLAPDLRRTAPKHHGNCTDDRDRRPQRVTGQELGSTNQTQDQSQNRVPRSVVRTCRRAECKIDHCMDDIDIAHSSESPCRAACSNPATRSDSYPIVKCSGCPLDFRLAMHHRDGRLSGSVDASQTAHTRDEAVFSVTTHHFAPSPPLTHG